MPTKAFIPLNNGYFESWNLSREAGEYDARSSRR